MPDTVRLDLRLSADAREIVVAELSDLGFDAFEETASGLVAYAPAATWDDTTREAVARLVGPLAMEETLVADQNWNAAWEATIQPIAVGPFVIAPTWAEPGPEHDGRTRLRIDPKMSFGTGYHPTTRISLRLLADRVPAGGAVLDVGTGTGVLAIAALRMGAATAVGVDIDPWSVDNATENAELNGVTGRLDVRTGSTEEVPERDFDLVCCNIVRPHLQPMLPELIERRASGAPLVLSGLLAAERDVFVAALTANGLAVEAEETEGDWWGCVAV